MNYLKVLLADDEKNVAEAIGSKLLSLAREITGDKVEGFVDIVNSAGEFVDRIRNDASEYGVAFNDNAMPVWGYGLRAIREVRTFNDQLPIYLISSSPVREKSWKDAGANGYIHKPSIIFDGSKVEKILRAYVFKTS